MHMRPGAAYAHATARHPGPDIKYIHLKSLTQGNEVTISRSNVSFFKKMSTFSPAEAYPQALRSITTKRTVNVNYSR